MTIKPVVSALTVIPALLHGDVDVAGGQYPSYIATQAKGLAHMRILAAGFALGPRVNEILAPATGSVHSLADLKGKTIAVNILNSEGADLIYSSLKAHGITAAQVRLVAMPFPAMLPALAAGKIAADYETEPFVTEAMKKYGDGELADMSSGPTTDMPPTGMARSPPGWRSTRARGRVHQGRRAGQRDCRQQPRGPRPGACHRLHLIQDYRCHGHRHLPHQRQPRADPAGRQPDAAIRAAEAAAQRQADDRGLTVTASGTAPAA